MILICKINTFFCNLLSNSNILVVATRSHADFRPTEFYGSCNQRETFWWSILRVDGRPMIQACFDFWGHFPPLGLGVSGPHGDWHSDSDPGLSPGPSSESMRTSFYKTRGNTIFENEMAFRYSLNLKRDFKGDFTPRAMTRRFKFLNGQLTSS